MISFSLGAPTSPRPEPSQLFRLDPLGATAPPPPLVLLSKIDIDLASPSLLHGQVFGNNVW